MFLAIALAMPFISVLPAGGISLELACVKGDAAFLRSAAAFFSAASESGPVLFALRSARAFGVSAAARGAGGCVAAVAVEAAAAGVLAGSRVGVGFAGAAGGVAPLGAPWVSNSSRHSGSTDCGSSWNCWNISSTSHWFWPKVLALLTAGARLISLFLGVSSVTLVILYRLTCLHPRCRICLCKKLHFGGSQWADHKAAYLPPAAMS